MTRYRCCRCASTVHEDRIGGRDTEAAGMCEECPVCGALDTMCPLPDDPDEPSVVIDHGEAAQAREARRGLWRFIDGICKS